MPNHLESLQEYFNSNSSESSKEQSLFRFFQKLFPNYKVQTDARNADGYVEGKLLVELKSDQKQWLSGLFQGLHYSKKGLSFENILVMSQNFIGIWQIAKLPEFVLEIAKNSEPQLAPNKAGVQNAKKITKSQHAEILSSTLFLLTKENTEDLFRGGFHTELNELVNILKNLDSGKIQVNPRNFIGTIEIMKKWFNTPLEAIHTFYNLLSFWDITSEFTENENGIQLISKQTTRSKSSPIIEIRNIYINEFKNFVLNRFVFTNEGSGLTLDYYFSRFDEVLAKVDKEYGRQHGVFFTDSNLAKFSLWFVKEYFEPKMNENYFVFDPCAGSGNLITSWPRGHLKHKIVSEFNPELIKILKKRMELDENAIGNFSVISEHNSTGLNFLDKSAEKYLEIIQKKLAEKNQKIDKPIAFLLNPPYKNTDENEKMRIGNDANYELSDSILTITGRDAGKERYLAFLAQVYNICRYQVIDNPEFRPIVMIFTPTSWLVPRPTYRDFRTRWDEFFEYQSGFIIQSNEFFALSGKWPLAFTIWQYGEDSQRQNKIKIHDYSNFKKLDLDINWNAKLDQNLEIKLKQSKIIDFGEKRESIKDKCGQKMYDFKRDVTKIELNSGKIFGGLPLVDERRNNKKTYGIENSDYIGFMDNCTPVRIKRKIGDIRFFKKSYECVWFNLANEFKNINSNKIHNGPPDKYGYCAYDLDSTKIYFSWFAISKTLSGNYPIWANQFDLWLPKIPKELENYFYSLCFALALAENRCVVTKFPQDNPVVDSPEVFVDNPLSPLNPESFYNTVLRSFIVENGLEIESQKNPKKNKNLPIQLLQTFEKMYQTFAQKCCSSGILQNVGLQNEPYFRYFDYADFLTPNSGIVQIRKYAEIHSHTDLCAILVEIKKLNLEIKNEIWQILETAIYFG